jgi:1-acyl-sn-glycerol-3-phosphate acyltransferase
VDAYTIRELVDRVVKEKGESPSDAPRWQSVFESRPSAEEIKFFEASRTFSAPFWFAIGRGIELIGRVLFDLQVSGRENLPKSGPFIICPNH